MDHRHGPGENKEHTNQHSSHHTRGRGDAPFTGEADVFESPIRCLHPLLLGGEPRPRGLFSVADRDRRIGAPKNRTLSWSLSPTPPGRGSSFVRGLSESPLAANAAHPKTTTRLWLGTLVGVVTDGAEDGLGGVLRPPPADVAHARTATRTWLGSGGWLPFGPARRALVVYRTGRPGYVSPAFPPPYRPPRDLSIGRRPPPKH